MDFFTILLLVSGSSSLVLWSTCWANFVICLLFPLQDFVFSEGVGISALELAVFFLPLDLDFCSRRQGPVSKAPAWPWKETVEEWVPRPNLHRVC
jgi:hypothetical protein